MNILPKTGIADIKLGMTKKEILTFLGQPMSKEENPDEDIWEFSNEVELSFQKNDAYLLSSIIVSSSDALLGSKNIVGISEADFLIEFPSFQLDEDFGENGKSYWDTELELMAWVFEGGVINVTVFPEYDEENDAPIWPSKNS